MAYTTIDKPTDYFKTVLYTGNDTDNRTISGVGFQPDWVWIKSRSDGYQHYLVDVVRGSTKVLFSDSNSSEQTRVSAIKSFASDGYVLGQEAQVNGNNNTYVSWNWKAGGSASSNSNGSITTSISANQDAGFSIVSYSGNSSNGATIGHGLGAAPKMVIIKKRSDSAQWAVGGTNIDSTFNGYMFLDSTGAIATSDNVFNDTAPSSSVVTLGTTGDSNANGQTYVAYCFAEKQGYSKFGSYIGNGSDTPNGVFVYLGFTPAYILIKATDSNSWVIVDNKRPANSNAVDDSLSADSTATETTGDSNTTFDFLSNGFKTNGNSGNNNSSGQKYIFMAFAESPFVTSTGIPATAR